MKSAKPKKYSIKASEVIWILDNRIGSSRLRQISRAFSIGHLESASMTLDGAPPKKFDRWYCKADILTIIDNCKSLKKAIDSGSFAYSERLDAVLNQGRLVGIQVPIIEEFSNDAKETLQSKVESCGKQDQSTD